MLGCLIPHGGGDPIPLLKNSLIVGRSESCDVVLRFPNVSSRHCQLNCDGGYWYVTDLDSSNGTKVNGNRVLRKRIGPGDKLSVAKHEYELQYSPVDIGAIGPPPPEEDEVAQIMNASLLQRAGLQRSRPEPPARRRDIRDSRAGQMKRPNANDD
ncbi:MAG: FHA domain-containing protein [Planctomycetes bacterium]|nr:FHA domain-containing protein [Planctomycetota bacterium]